MQFPRLVELYSFTHCREMANGKCTRTWRGNSILVLLLYVTSTFRAVPGSGPACSSALGEGECVQTQQPSGSNCAAENTVSHPLHVVNLHTIYAILCSSSILHWKSLPDVLLPLRHIYLVNFGSLLFISCYPF